MSTVSGVARPVPAGKPPDLSEKQSEGCYSLKRSYQHNQGSGVVIIVLVNVLIPFLPRKELGNIVPTACEIVQRIHIGLVSLTGNILVLRKPTKLLIYPHSVFLGIIVDGSIVVIVILRVIYLLLRRLCRGHH